MKELIGMKENEANRRYTTFGGSVHTVEKEFERQQMNNPSETSLTERPRRIRDEPAGVKGSLGEVKNMGPNVAQGYGVF